MRSHVKANTLEETSEHAGGGDSLPASAVPWGLSDGCGYSLAATTTHQRLFGTQAPIRRF